MKSTTYEGDDINRKIPFLKGRPISENIINEQDIAQLHQTLQGCKTAQEFINELN